MLFPLDCCRLLLADNSTELETLATEPGLAITTTSLPSISPTSSTSQVDGAISFEGEKKTSSGGDGPNKGAIIGGLIGKCLHTPTSHSWNKLTDLGSSPTHQLVSWS